MSEQEYKVQEVDLNDVSLSSEELGPDYDPQAESRSPLAPVPDGRHRAKLVRQKDWKATKDQNGRVVKLGTTVRGDIEVGGKHYVTFDPFISTKVSKEGGTTAGDLIAAITGKRPVAKDHVGLAKELDRLLAGEPTVEQATRWEAQCTTCKDDKGYSHTIKRGQKGFPKNADGVHSHLIECDECGEEVEARARVTKYYPVNSKAPVAQAASVGAPGFGPDTSFGVDEDIPF